jgi:chemotaxis protein methyltransferase CheR
MAIGDVIGRTPVGATANGELTAFEVANVCRLVQERAGVSLSAEKAYVVHCRLNVLAMSLGLRSARDVYRAISVDQKGELAQAVVDTLLTKETSFFRNPPAFSALQEEILPRAFARRDAIRIWCAACATGQEPYSVAMVAHEVAAGHAQRSFRIRATDYSEIALEKARSGRYSQLEISRGLPMTMVIKHMDQLGHEFQVRPSLSAAIEFERHNLLDAVGYRHLYDVVLCRNVLIYFDMPERERILRQLARSILPGGFLVLGASECSSHKIEGLHQEQYKKALFYRKEG